MPSRFDQVAELSESDQSRLLSDGDAPERLWAAWSLALRIGRDAVPALRSLEQGDVPDGLRSQLLVVLAGLGERQLLLTIAETEASETVRAAATTLYIRTSVRGSTSDAIDFARRQLRAAPALVRRAILAEQHVGNLSLPAEALLPTLRDSDAETRAQCAACLLAGAAGAEVLAAVVEAYLAERDPEVRAAFLRVLPRAAVRDVLGAAAQRGSSAVVEALNALHELYSPLTWADVAGLINVTTLPVGCTILARGVRPEPPDGLRWLCQLLRLALADPSPIAIETRWRCLHAIEQAIADGAHVTLDDRDKALLRSVFEKRLAEYRAEVEEHGPDSDDGPYLEDIDHLIRVLR